MFETSLHNVNEYRHRAMDLLLREFLLGLYLLLPDSESVVQEVDFKQFMRRLAVADRELSAGLNRAKVTVLRNKVYVFTITNVKQILRLEGLTMASDHVHY